MPTTPRSNARTASSAGIAPVIGSANPDRIRACRDAVQREPELTHEEWYRLWITARGEALP